MTLSVLGCGWLGEPLAAFFAAQGFRVNGSTTSREKLPRLEQAGIAPCLIDLDREEDETLKQFLKSDWLLIALPPKKEPKAYIDRIKKLLSYTPAATTVILISSTSVYPDTGTTVDETTPVTAETTPRPHILEAEAAVWAFSKKHLILRCGGLMGYDRIGIRYFCERPVPFADTPVNQVHRDDVIAAVAHLIPKKVCGTYNLVAPGHPTRRVLYTHQAERIRCTLPTFEAGKGISKIVRGDAVCRDTGFIYRYPDPLTFA